VDQEVYQSVSESKPVAILVGLVNFVIIQTIF